MAFAPTIVLALVTVQAAASPVALAQQSEARPMTRTLPHTLRKGETAWLLVKVGVVGREQIDLTTQDGRPVGTISPFAVRAGQAAGTYTIPVAPEVFENGKLALRLSVAQAGGGQRAATADEVKSVRLIIRRLGGGS